MIDPLLGHEFLSPCVLIGPAKDFSWVSLLAVSHMGNRTTKSWASVTHMLGKRREEQPSRDTGLESGAWLVWQRCLCNALGISGEGLQSTVSGVGLSQPPRAALTPNRSCWERFGECHAQTWFSPAPTSRNSWKLSANAWPCVRGHKSQLQALTLPVLARVSHAALAEQEESSFLGCVCRHCEGSEGRNGPGQGWSTLTPGGRAVPVWGTTWLPAPGVCCQAARMLCTHWETQQGQTSQQGQPEGQTLWPQWRLGLGNLGLWLSHLANLMEAAQCAQGRDLLL